MGGNNKWASDEERFWAKVDIGEADECWPWLASKKTRYYGQFGLVQDGRPRVVSAHKFAWESQVGPVPEGHELHHRCRNSLCMNVAHMTVLDPIAHRQITSAHARKTHCPQGHPYSPENTYTYKRKDGGVRRFCKTCVRQKAREKRNHCT